MGGHPLDGNAIAADEHYADTECDGCAGGDKWPIKESHWRCPVCDTEYFDDDGDIGKDAALSEMARLGQEWDAG